MKQRGVVSKPAKQIEDGLGTGTGGDVLNVTHKDAVHTITTYCTIRPDPKLHHFQGGFMGQVT